MKHGKKYVDSAKLIDRTKLYEVDEALDIAVKTATAKFDETVEVHVRLGVDSRHADQQVRGAVVLPNGTGKTVRVAVFAKGDDAEAAVAAGAEVVGAEDLVAKIQGEGFMDFDVAIATPNMMGLVGRLGKVLGPRGLMPSPKAGTVTPDVAKAVNEAKAGKIEYRLDKTNIIHCPIGIKVPLTAAKAKKLIDGGYAGKTVVMGIRPENINDDPAVIANSECVFESTIRVYELLGAEVYLYFEIGETNVTARVNPKTTARPGDTVKFTMDLSKVHVFDKETEQVITN